MNKHWWQEAVVYQVYPRSFQDTNDDGIGDLQGIIQHLDYIKNLGATVIWLNPIYRSPNDDNGYDIADYQAIMPEFGTMADFKQLLDAVHAHGMKLMMDLVVNHTSDEHRWFVEAKQSKTSPYHDYYIWRDAPAGQTPTNWRSEFGGSAWQYVPEVGQYYLHIFSKKQPDLNWQNPAVRQDIFSMMDWWCEQGIDGFRMDVINLISKPDTFVDDPTLADEAHGSSLAMVANGPHVHDYLKAMHQQVLSQHDLITVGETPAASTEDAINYTGFDRDELQMVFQFEHMGLDDDPVMGKWTDKKAPLLALKQTMSKWQTALNGRAWNSLYWNNHDQARAVSRFGNDAPEYRVLSAKMLANCLHNMQGTPYIYQGEELGMTNVAFDQISDYRDLDTLNAYHELVDLQHTVDDKTMLHYIHRRSRDNARTPMQWNQSTNAGFSNQVPWLAVNPNYRTINAEQALADPDSVYYFYQRLNQLRKAYPVIVYGDYTLLDPEDAQVYAYTRQLNDEQLLVISNFTAETVTRHFDLTDRELLISNYSDAPQAQLRPYETRTYYRRG
jgi:oligo-1,6-glucosidase